MTGARHLALAADPDVFAGVKQGLMIVMLHFLGSCINQNIRIYAGD